jgi:ATP-dependent Clp protease ATP-binding subunit ClpA
MSFATDVFHDNQNRLSAGAPGATDPHGSSVVRFDAGSVTARLRERILGQGPAVDAVDRVLRVIQMGLQDPERPLASLLFVGPTGVGKTELVRRLAAEIRGSSDDFCRVDMGSLAQEHYAASFAGAPPGYAGSKEGHSVFDRDLIEGDPYRPGIVLFDEVEKAHPAVLRALLHVLDRGMLRLSNGQQTINFRNSIVFLTSNLGSREIADRQRLRSRTGQAGLLNPLARRYTHRTTKRVAREDERIVVASVREFFDPEFLNRIDDTVVFEAVDEGSAVPIAQLELQLLQARLRKDHVALDFTPAAAEAICSLGFDPTYGARSIRRTIQRHVLSSLADSVRQGRGQGRQAVRIRLDVEGGALVTTFVSEPSGAGPARFSIEAAPAD